MKDIVTHWEKLRADAAECAMIRDLAVDKQKRELFARLAEHLDTLASEVERAMTARANGFAERSRREVRSRLCPLPHWPVLIYRGAGISVRRIRRNGNAAACQRPGRPRVAS